MNILYVATDIEVPNTGVGYSGGSVHAYEVAKNLVEMKNNVYLVCMKGHPEQKSFENYKGINIYRIYSGTDKARSIQKNPAARKILNLFIPIITRTIAISFGVRIAMIAHKNKCDLIYERSSSMGAGAYASYITGKPLVLEMNDPVATTISLSRSKVIITTQKEMVKGKADEKKIIEVTWGANTELFNPKVDAGNVIKQYDLDNKIVLLYMGSFAPWHGIGDIVSSATIIIEKFKKIRFLMIGAGGPEYSRCLEKIKKLGLDEYFIFTGAVDYEKIPQYISAADITLAPFNPKKHEMTNKYSLFYTPLKIFEYMACGKPIISTSTGNVKKMITNGVTGILIEPGDSKALAEKIIYLIHETDLRYELGINARKKVVEKYSWKKHVEQLQNIFVHVAGKIQ